MSLKKQSDKHLRMEKKESSFKKENDTTFNSVETDFKSSQSKVSNNSGIKDKTQNALSDGVKSYKKELESDDYGVESVNKISEHAFKNTKNAINKVQDFYSNRTENKLQKSNEQKNGIRKPDNNFRLEKSNDQQFRLTKNKLNDEFKERNINPNLKLPKDNQLGSDDVKISNLNKRGFKRADDKYFKSVTQKLGNEKKLKAKKQIPKTTNNNKQGFLKKVLVKPKNLAQSGKNKGIESFKDNLESDDDGVKTGVRGSKLVKDNVKSVIQAKRVRNKKRATGKLKGSNTKLKTEGKLRKATLNSNFKKGQKTQLKKKAMRNNILKNKGKNSISLSSFTKKTGASLKNGINGIRKLASVMFRKVIATKVFAGVGAIAIKLFPVALVIGFIFTIIIVIMSIGTGGGNEEMNNAGGSENISPEVEQWRGLVTEVAENNNMSDYVDLILAIIQIESGGDQYKDIMQSSESAGFGRNHFQNERDSVEQGVSHLKNVLSILKGYNSDYLNDVKLIAQSYNFGLAFPRFVGSNDYDGYSIDISEKFSKDVVAPSLGNTSGSTYSYVNSVSESVGKTYLYDNGGNYLYGELISQYISDDSSGSSGDYADGEIAPPVSPMTVTSTFGYRPPEATNGIGTTIHKGLDLGCVGGQTPISSILDGEVVRSQNVSGLGNAVVVKHDSNFYSTYGHMSSLTSKTGQKVKAGDQLGICGSTGNSTRPHLHLEISPTPHQDQVDPYPYIKHLIGG